MKNLNFKVLLETVKLGLLQEKVDFVHLLESFYFGGNERKKLDFHKLFKTFRFNRIEKQSFNRIKNSISSHSWKR